jgi:glutathione-regulated potassium-efflux system ancillary protein KefF
MLDLVYAHPYPDRSRANRHLLEAVRDLPGVDLRSLYDRYPAFDIDVPEEQAALERSGIVVWQHPLHWYSVPGLLKHWFDKVLARGWAYGDGGHALRGKRCLWVVTTGGDDDAYSADGIHGRPLDEYVPVIEQTAIFCGMRWEPPLIVQGVHGLSDADLGAVARTYRERLRALLSSAEAT